MNGILRLELLALLWVCCGSEPLYFLISNNSTWTQARQHCQVCYKEMVSLNPENVHHLVQNLSSNYTWIGLRKNLNGPMPWSRWSNGESVSYQNWYPGRPVLSKPKVPVVEVYNYYSCPKCDCCCIKTSPSTDTPNTTTWFDENTTDYNTLAHETTPVTIPVTTPVMTPMTIKKLTNGNSVNGTNDTSADNEEKIVYIEDPCVSMASFGLWFEKNCSEVLPYMCYEDRFYGHATMTNITLHSGTLSWLAGPGDINSYRVEVKGVFNKTFNHNVLSYHLTNMTSGTLYTIQVFPIKCERELNPQNVSFYTKPDVVQNLTVNNVTETSAFLSWSPPEGNHDFYQVRVRSEPKLYMTNITTAEAEVKGLIPGGCYMFEVNVGVNDGSKEGDGVNTTAYTKPGKVLNLTTTDPTKNSFLLIWEKPYGNSSSYRVNVSNIENNSATILYNNITVNTSLRVTELPAGSMVGVSVVTLVSSSSVEGDPVTVNGYTAPEPVSNLSMVTDTHLVNATWEAPSKYEDFLITLRQDNTLILRECRTNHTYMKIDSLLSSITYFLTVKTKIGNLTSEVMSISNYTLPEPPRNLKVQFVNTTSITLTWDPPNLSSDAGVNYRVLCSSEIRNQRFNDTVGDKTYTFHNLYSGTLYMFEVYTVAGGHISNSLTKSQMTETKINVLILEMECSSTTAVCGETATKVIILNKLNTHMSTLKNELVLDLELREK